MHAEDLYAERAIRAGARGYVMKHASAETLLAAIRRVLEGKVYLSPVMTEKLIAKAAGGEPAAGGSAVDGLSDRELEIFKLIGRGLRPQRIAEELLLSIKTVETYSSRLKLKLGVKDAAGLLQLAIAWHADLQESDERP
jgi:DNA-binding NarL/FixJ family response regulator